MKHKFLFSVFIIFFIFVFIGLGTWQIIRLNWKNNLILEIENSLKNPPVELAQSNKENFLKIKTSGSIDFDKQIYLYNLNESGTPGFEVINPITIGDENFLINRGWIPFEKKGTQEINVFDQNNIIGTLKTQGRKNIFKPDNDIEENYWFSLNREDISKFTSLNKEYSEITPVVELYGNYNHSLQSIQESKEMLYLEDREIIELAKQEIEDLESSIEIIEKDLKLLLLPKDNADDGAAYLEIRAGAGGDEAAIFASDLLRLYSRFCEREGWKFELMTNKVSEPAGTKEAVMKIDGDGVYKYLKFESGVHRVQRVPETESQGRIHTSTVTAAVLPVADEVEEVEIDKNDLRVDTFRASGAGGQHVNKTDSAVRITHIPTNIVVQCQSDRSQHKNRSNAMKMIKSRIYETELQKRKEDESIKNKEKKDIGWGNQIRSYVLQPYRLVKDNRTNFESTNPDKVLDGQLDEFLESSLYQII